MEVEILSSIFRQKMSELGFENYEVILQSWRDDRKLEHDPKNLTIFTHHQIVLTIGTMLLSSMNI